MLSIALDAMVFFSLFLQAVVCLILLEIDLSVAWLELSMKVLVCLMTYRLNIK